MRIFAVLPATLAYGLLVAILSSSASPARAGVPGSFHVRGFAGVTTHPIGDVNKALDEYERYVNAAGIPVQWDHLPAGFPFGGEVSYTLTDTWSVGVGASYSSSKVENAFQDVNGSINDDVESTFLDVAANVTYDFARWAGLSVGAGAGFSATTLTESFRYRDFADSLNNLSSNGDWDANGFVANAFVTYERGIGSGFSVFGRGGGWYRYLGDLDGTVSNSLGASSTGPPRGQDGTAIEISPFGGYVQAGIGFAFGGRTE